MELVRAAQEARRAKLQLAPPPVASSASEPEEDADEKEGLQVDEDTQPVALPPAVDHGMKEVMEARRRRQAAADPGEL